MGAYLAQRRPGLRQIRINYCSGHFYNFESAQFATIGPRRHQIRLFEHQDEITLDLPSSHEAVVPRRSRSRPPTHSPP